MEPSNQPKKKLLETIDCTINHPPSKFFENGTTTICTTPIGKYRECNTSSFSRFGYRFTVDKLGHPHEICVKYPDDKRRFMCIMDGTSYDLTTSVMTGFTQPLSHQMLSIQIIFWPRWKDCSIVFMTYGEGEPAAVSSIEISELDDLPPLFQNGHQANDLGTVGPFRELGIQYEDPCGTSASEGAITHQEWVEHIISYAKHSGQRLFMYPMVWYHGPQFPSDIEFSDGMDLVVSKDGKRTQYTRWITKPTDWYTPMLQRFEEEGLGFIGVLTLLRLGSLMKRMNTNIYKIRRGEDTINNMLWNDKVQAGTKDWTPIYNSINYNRIAKSMKPGKIYPGFRMPRLHPKYVYGEHSRGPTNAGSIFNPLHPTVQEAIVAFIDEVGRRYGKFASFKGITFNMYASSMLWYGSIHSGYDDYSIGLFEKETGIRIPVKNKDPHRFSKRYNYIMFVCKDAWIQWRCQKIYQFIVKIRNTLQLHRKDLRIIITMWDETVMMPLFGTINASHQIFARKSNVELFKEAGIDFALFKNESGIELDLGMGCTRDRGGHGKKPAGGITLQPEDNSMYRDFDFLDEPMHEEFAQLRHSGGFIFNCWVESWGKHIWQHCAPDDPNVEPLSSMDGKKSDGILQINSLYPADGFWWDSQLRIIPGLQAGDHFMEPYAHAMAEYDVCRLSRGGLFLDKGHTAQIQKFAKAYCQLPAEKFKTVGTTTDPIAVRVTQQKDKSFFYIVNRDYYPVIVKLFFGEKSATIRDISNNQIQNPTTEFEVKLGPYELQAFSTSGILHIDRFTAEIPPHIEDQLRTSTEVALNILKSIEEKGFNIPGMKYIQELIPKLLEQKKFAKLRRVLTSYILREAQIIYTMINKK